MTNNIRRGSTWKSASPSHPLPLSNTGPIIERFIDSELIELSDAMQRWGTTTDNGVSVDHDQGLFRINQQYAQFFRDRFYFVRSDCF
jgi:hypothetical protein